MRLMLVSGGGFPLVDTLSFEACRSRAREVLAQERDLDLQAAKALCEFLDFPEADEATLDLEDPLRFATIRVMGYLRQHHPGSDVLALCRFSPAAQDLLALIEDEPRRSRGKASC